MRRGFSILAVVGLLSLLVTACQTSASGSPTESAAAAGASAAPGESVAAGGTEIGVALQEWAVLPSADSAPAGDITFVVVNEGPDDVHEFVIFRTDLDPADLPTDATGTVDETAEGIEVIDEVEDLAVGDSAELTVTLEAGSYILVCNRYDETEQEAHYAMGMYTTFSVE